MRPSPSSRPHSRGSECHAIGISPSSTATPGTVCPREGSECKYSQRNTVLFTTYDRWWASDMTGICTLCWVSREVGERELAVAQGKSPQNDLSRGDSAGLKNLTFLTRVNDAQLLHQLRGRPPMLWRGVLYRGLKPRSVRGNGHSRCADPRGTCCEARVSRERGNGTFTLKKRGTGVRQGARWRMAQLLILVAKSICTRDYAHSSPRSTCEQNPGKDFATNII